MSGAPRSHVAPSSALALRRRVYAVELRSMRRTYQQIADAVLPCPEHRDRGGITPAACRQQHEAHRLVDGPNAAPIDCTPMYANRKGAQRAVEQGLAEAYSITEADRDRLRREQLATIDLALQRLMRDTVGGGDAIDRARAANAVARLLERAAKLTGLDAPTRVTVTTELDDELSSALADLAETPLPTPQQLTEG